MTEPVLDHRRLPDGRTIVVVRDDLVQGGTKRRALVPMIRARPEPEFVFGGPAYGYAQLALAYACAAAGRQATYFVAQRGKLHPLTEEAAAAGANIVQVPHGYLSVVQAAAKTYAAKAGAYFYPLGFDVPEFHEHLHAIASTVAVEPPQVWTVAGSGALSRALQRRWPEAEHHTVRIGFPPTVGTATLHTAPEKFEQPAKLPPPYPSSPWYDAKAWRFVLEHATTGALVWNVGA